MTLNKGIMFKIILFVELVALGYLLINSFKPREVFQINLPACIKTQEFPVTQTGEEVCINNENWIEPKEYDFLISDSYNLNKGGYEVEITYTADLYNNSQKNINNVVGSLSFVSDNRWVLATSLKLPDGAKHKITRIWLLDNLDDLKFKVIYNGNGMLSITSIVVKESLLWRITSILKFLFYFLLIDIIFILFIYKPLLISEQKKNIILTLSIISFFSSLLCIGRFLYFGHDIGFHINRIYYLAEAIVNGQLPCRIYQGMLNGYGYATSIFYCDIFLYIPAIMYLFFCPLQYCYQTYMVIINIVTCIISYYCFKKITNDTNYALLGSFLYTNSAYRFIDLYVRQAVGEYTAMVFLPLIVYGIWKVYTKKAKVVFNDFFPLIAGITGVIFCHVLTAEMCFMFIILFGIIYWRRTFRKDMITNILKSASIILLLSVWYAVPLYQTLNYVNIDENTLKDIQALGGELSQLFGVFHTVSGGGTNDGTYHEMPIAIGISLTIIILIYIFIYVHRSSQVNKDSSDIKEFNVINILFVLGAFAVFLASSLCPWDSLKGISPAVWDILSKINWPWRYLAIATVLLVTMGIVMLQYMEKIYDKKLIYSIMFILVSFNILTEGSFMVQYAYEIESVIYYTDNDINNFRIGVYKEYLIKGTEVFDMYNNELILSEGTELGNYTYNKGAYLVSCSNNSNEEAYIDMPILNYPNYYAIDINSREKLKIVNGTNNRVRVILDSNYKGVISISYKEPVNWRVSELISLTTLIGIIIYWYKKRGVSL